MPLGIAFEPKPDAIVVAATTAFAVIATVLSGLGPALKLSKTDLVADLKALAADGSPVLGRRFSARNVMVVGQIALSLMLLSAGRVVRARRAEGRVRQSRLQLRPAVARRHGSDARPVRRDARARQLSRGAWRGFARCPASRRSAWRHRCRSAISTRGTRSSASAAPARPEQAARSEATYRIIGADYFRALNLPDGARPRVHANPKRCRRPRRASPSSTSVSRASCSGPTIRSGR